MIGHGAPHVTAYRALDVSQAWFYKWRGGDVSLRRARRAALTAAIKYWFFKLQPARWVAADRCPGVQQHCRAAYLVRRQLSRSDCSIAAADEVDHNR